MSSKKPHDQQRTKPDVHTHSGDATAGKQVHNDSEHNLSSQTESSSHGEGGETGGKRSHRFLWGKVLFWLLISPILLLFLLITLLYIPPIQQRVVEYVEGAVNKSGKLSLSLGHLHLGFPLSLSVGEVALVQASADTMLRVEEVKLRINPLPLLRGKIASSRLTIRNLYLYLPNEANTSHTLLEAGQLEIGDFVVDIKGERVKADALLLAHGAFSYFDADTVVKPPSPPFPWHFSIGQVDFTNTLVEIAMPYDSLLVSLPFKLFDAERLFVAVDSLDIHAKSVAFETFDEAYYCRDEVTPEAGAMDYGRIYTEYLAFAVKDFALADGLVAFAIQDAQMKEQSGAEVERLRGDFKLHNNIITVGGLDFGSPTSRLKGDLRLPLMVFSEESDEPILAKLRGRLSLADVGYYTGLSLDGETPEAREGLQLLAREPFEIDTHLEGPMRKVLVNRLEVERKDLLKLSLAGYASYPLEPKKLRAKASLQSEVGEELERLLPIFSPSLAQQIRIPGGTSLEGTMEFSPQQYSTQLTLVAPSEASINLLASYTPSREAYKLKLRSQAFPIASYLPHIGLGEVSLEGDAEGQHFDLFAPAIRHKSRFVANALEYKGRINKGLALSASLVQGLFDVRLASSDSLAPMSVAIDGTIKEEQLAGKLAIIAPYVPLHRLGLVSDTLAIGLSANGSFSTDLKEHHTLELTTDQLLFEKRSLRISHDRLQLALASQPEETSLALQAGDLEARVALREPLNTVGAKLDSLGGSIRSLTIDSLATPTLTALLGTLPESEVRFKMGSDNPLTEFLREQRLYAEKVSLAWHTDPRASELLLTAVAEGVRKDTLKIDSLSLRLASMLDAPSFRERLLASSSNYFPWAESRPDSLLPSENQHLLQLTTRVKSPARPGSPPFEVALDVATDLKLLSLDARYTQKDEVLHKLGVVLHKNRFGYGLAFKPESFYLMGNPLRPTEKNAVFYNVVDKKLLASLRLKAEGEGEVELTSIAREGEDGDKLNLLVRHLDLSLLEGLAGLGNIEGLSFADVLVEEDPITKNPRITADLSVNNFRYEGSAMGNVSTALFYEPMGKSTHLLNAFINHNGNLVLSVDGRYDLANKQSPILANVSVESLPLLLANPFIGSEVATISGLLDGAIKVSGSSKQLALEGSLHPDATFAYIPSVGEIFSLEMKPIRFERNKMIIDEIELKPVDKSSPLKLYGSLNLFAPDALNADLHIVGSEVTLLDSKRARGQLLYGKILVSPSLSLKGKLSAPSITGQIDLLGGTNATYVYKGAQLKAKNNMAGVVVFTDFADTVFQKQEPTLIPTLGGANVAVNLNIDPAVRLGVDFDANHQDYVVVQGGGNLSLRIPPFSEMSLIGNYQFSGGGDFRYEIPVVGRKIFEIDPSSSIAWNGDVLKPSVHFKAVNHVRGDVVENEMTRKVDFDVLILAKENESGYEIAFDLDAPNDLSVKNKIAAMSQEERGKQAIALMVTGAFLAGEAGQASMQKILSNLAVSELNNLTGKFLQGTDFSIGMELRDDGTTGSIYTDYTYSFSKRFYNDRIRIVLGGSVATGNLPTNYEQTFIDNVTLEYRLDRTGNQYLSLLHRRNNDNLFEGLVTETGVSYMLRKKLYRLSDFFKREKKRVEEATSPLRRGVTADDETVKTPTIDSLSTSEQQPRSPENSETNKPQSYEATKD